MNKLFFVILLCGVTVLGYGGELLPLEKNTWTVSNADRFKDSAKIELTPLKGTNRQVPSLVWTTMDALPTKSISVGVRKLAPLDEFEQAEFILTVQVEKELPLRRIVIRFRDNSGETFQLAPTATGSLTPGKNELHYVFDTTNPSKSTDSIWGGNANKKVDWPLQIAGIAIDLNAQTPNNERILLDALEVRYLGERCTISLNTGHPLHLLLPGQKSQPTLEVKNISEIPLDLSGSMKITDFNQEIHTENVSVKVPADGEAPIIIPVDYTQLGWWKVDYTLKSATGKVYTGTHRLGRMNPAGPTPGRSEGEFLFGMCCHAYSPEIDELNALASGMCGVKIARTDFYWRRIQPQRDKWNFSINDRIVETYGRHGIEILAILNECVKWAEKAGYTPKNPNLLRDRSYFPDLQAYADYVSRVTNRYKDRIRYYEIWNEPDLIGFANFPAEDYLEMLRIAYDTIKKVSPNAIVMNGGIASFGTNRGGMANHNNGILDLLLADGGKHFDIFALHVHGNFFIYNSQLQKFHNFDLIGNKAPRPWYSNETGITSTMGDEFKQGSTLFQKMLYAWSEGAMGYNWYLIREKPEFPVGHSERHFGLITPNFEPKPGYLVYNTLANLYSGGRFLRRLDFTPGIYACLFENKTQDGLLGLWGNGVSKILWITGLPEGTTKIDLFGNETPFPVHNGLAIVQISDKPFSLRIPKIAKQNIQCTGAVFSENSPKQLSVSAGESHDFSITLNNPMKQDLDLNLNVQTTGKVSAKLPSSKLRIPAGGSKAVPIKLTAEQGFKATPVSPEKLVITIALAGDVTKTVEIPVISRISEDDPRFELVKPEQYYSFIESTSINEPWYWKGPDDLSAKVYIKIQDTSLLIKVEVRDDVHVQPFRGSDVWKGDNIQFGLQIPGQNGYWKFGLTRLADGKSAIFRWEYPNGFADSRHGITLKTTRDETTKITTYLANLQLKMLGMTPAVATSGFRFNLIVNDNDDDRREGFMYIAPGLGLGGDEPTLWPVVNF